MAQRRLKPLPKFLLIVGGIVLAGYLVYKYAPISSSGGGVPDGIFGDGKAGPGEYDPAKGNPKARKLKNPGGKLGRPVQVGVVTWGGYAGGQYFNGGFSPNENSRYKSEFDIEVNFKVMDDFVASREAWKAGEVDFLWVTVDAFPTETGGLKEFKPKFVFQADWSRGGDVIVVKPGINNVADLKGKKVAFAELTPSHTFLLWLLDSGGLNINAIKQVKFADAIKAAEAFKAGQVDAAVVWSPDDDACVEKVPGSKRLITTKKASHIIADGFFAKKDFLDKYPAETQALVAGFMIGASEINSDPEAKDKAADILAAGLNMPKEFCVNAINNVRLTTFGDNMNFFGRKGATGEDLYSRMTTVYGGLGLSKGAPQWRRVSTRRFVESINLVGEEHNPETVVFGEPTQKEIDNPTVIASKPVSIHFPSGSYTISAEGKTVIHKEVVPMIQAAGNARIRIEGNTDNTAANKANGKAYNKKLSKQRAAAVRKYLVSKYGFDKNKFIVIGNGEEKPLLSNATAVGRAANRRTDIVVIQ